MDYNSGVGREQNMLGDAIRTERKRHGWTQHQLAGLTGLAQTYISKLELNQRPRPDWDTLEKLATAFNITVADLLRAGGLLDAPSASNGHAPDPAALVQQIRELPLEYQAKAAEFIQLLQQAATKAPPD